MPNSRPELSEALRDSLRASLSKPEDELWSDLGPYVLLGALPGDRETLIQRTKEWFSQMRDSIRRAVCGDSTIGTATEHGDPSETANAVFTALEGAFGVRESLVPLAALLVRHGLREFCAGESDQ